MSAKRIQRIFAQMVAWMNPTPTPVAALKAKLWQRTASIAVVRFIKSVLGRVHKYIQQYSWYVLTE